MQTWSELGLIFLQGTKLVGRWSLLALPLGPRVLIDRFFTHWKAVATPMSFMAIALHDGVWLGGSEIVGNDGGGHSWKATSIAVVVESTVDNGTGGEAGRAGLHEVLVP